MKNKMIKIPASTLNMLKQMLTKEVGVDLSPIIDDLTIGQSEEQRDLIAVNSLLVFNGYHPQIDVPSRLFSPGHESIRVFSYRGYSSIRSRAIYSTCDIYFEEGTWKMQDGYIVAIDLSELSDFMTDLNEAIALIAGKVDVSNLADIVIDFLKKN